MAINEREINEVLVRNGVPHDADEVLLTGFLEERGWQAQVEAPLTDDPRRGGRARRYRALAFRRIPRGIASDAFLVHEHRRATGESAEAALRRVLAAVLEREPAGAPLGAPPPPYGVDEGATPA